MPLETPGLVTWRDMQVRLRQVACRRPGCPCRETARQGHGLTHCPLHPLRPEATLDVRTLPDFTLLAECSEGCDQMRLWRALVGPAVIAWEKARWENIVDESRPAPRKARDVQGIEVY